MKNLILIFCTFLLSLQIVSAQSTSIDNKKIKTETIDVSGTCGMCKKRIEKAAYIHGVKRVEWNKESKKLSVSYNPKQVSLDDISKKIAEAGHDANGVHADDKVYHTLPNCCEYRSGANCTH